MPRHEMASRAAVARKGMPKPVRREHMRRKQLSPRTSEAENNGAPFCGSRCRRAAKPVCALSGAWSLPTGASFEERSEKAALGFAALPLQFASRPRRQAFLHRSQKGAGKVAPRILYPPRLHRSAVPAARLNKWVKRSQRYRNGACILPRAMYLY